MTRARLYRVILPVADLDRAVGFWSRVLTTSGERVSPGRHYFDCGGVVLACYDPVADGDELGEGWRWHEHQYLYLAVDDLDEVRNRVREAGGHGLTEIASMPWGERLFYARDPLGSQVCFVDAATVFTGSG